MSALDIDQNASSTLATKGVRVTIMKIKKKKKMKD